MFPLKYEGRRVYLTVMDQDTRTPKPTAAPKNAPAQTPRAPVLSDKLAQFMSRMDRELGK